MKGIDMIGVDTMGIDTIETGIATATVKETGTGTGTGFVIATAMYMEGIATTIAAALLNDDPVVAIPAAPHEAVIVLRQFEKNTIKSLPYLPALPTQMVTQQLGKNCELSSRWNRKIRVALTRLRSFISDRLIYFVAA